MTYFISTKKRGKQLPLFLFFIPTVLSISIFS